MLEWKNKVDGVDDILAEDINNIAHAVMDLVVDQTYNPKSENAQSGKAVAEAVEDCAKKLKKKEFADGETITVEDNTLYVAKTDITSLTIIYPNTDFICSLEFAIVNEGNVTITLPESKYIGGVPSFANGESWEINIKNGVVVGGKVE